MSNPMTAPPGTTTDAASPRERSEETPLELQRRALRDLVALSTECATTESQIERDHADAIEQGRKDYEKTVWTIRQRYDSTRDSVNAKSRELLEQIESKYQAVATTVEAETVPRVQKIDRDHESLEHNLSQKLNHAIWLAESVFDVAQNQAREEYKKTREKLTTYEEASEALDGQALATVQRYAFQPAQSPVEAPPVTPDEKAETEYEVRRAEAARHLEAMRRLFVPKLFVGGRAWLIGSFFVLAAAAYTHWRTGYTTPDWKLVGIVAGSTLLVIAAALIALRLLAKRQVVHEEEAFRKALAGARRAVEAHHEYAKAVQNRKLAEAKQRRDMEVQRARDHFLPMIDRSARQRDESLEAVRADYRERLASETAERDRGRKQSREQLARDLAEVERRRERDLATAKERHEQHNRDSKARYEAARAALERRLHEGLSHIRTPVAGEGDGALAQAKPWDDASWRNWKPPTQFPQAVRFGELHVDLKKIADAVPTAARAGANGSGDGAKPSNGNGVRLDLPKAFAMTAALGFPRQASLLVQADRPMRDEAIRTLQMVMTRLLTTVPPGRLRFTIIDPVGLGQSFAGFMHLADHDENLVGGRIWTEQDQIEQRLTNLTSHMETVIQKYLRNEFETIDEYNAQAGELAEPYRFLVIADFPHTLTEEAMRRLAAISSTGARCGVYTLIHRDTRVPVSGETLLDTLEANSVNIVQQGDRFAWKDEVFGQFPLVLDRPPGEEFLTRTLDVVGRYAKEANRVEVSFDSIAPHGPAKFWSGDATEELSVPVGRMGATRLQALRLGRGVAQHVLIAGKTGSGKSTLLHALVTNLAMWYSPDEVEFYLIDFKKGVEFKTYATHGLPHARAIAVESDREFGLSVLQRLDAELARRGELFRKAGVQDLASYRRTPGAQRMPRTLLIIDEFQEFFSEDDKLAQDASVLLDRLVRQGRAFGVHVLLGSQTIGGSSGLPRSTIGQMAVRIALQTSEADSQLILGDNNAAAKLLGRPGEAIYNDQGGLVEGNSPFQVAWLPDDKREQYLDHVLRRTRETGMRPAPTIVFEGNAPADVARNAKLAALLDGTVPRRAATSAVEAYLGEPVAIKDPTAIVFRRQSGSNALIIGQYDEAAMSIMAAMMVSLAAQRPSGGAVFYVMDGTTADSPLAGVFGQVAGVLPHEVKKVAYRDVPAAVNEIAAEVQRRRDHDQPGAPDLFVFVYALQRYRALRKSEDTFSFSTSDEEKAPAPDKQFAEVLREGPAVGVHVVAWSDTAVALDRTLERQSMREFDNRVLFQMSAADSSNLIDSPAANKLGLHRALAYSEEQGVTEKFRPYGLPEAQWLQHVKERLTAAALAAKP
ncbi:MAG TPA: FtsK/SpoIIIE domain-containing protein [Tepidisphaeraceae bacterium]|nr:FtsK/SpoIIIE domain-containing protein [Tepidisphaeraceae bacterium]